MEQIHKKYNAIIASVVLAITFLAYLYTVAPTVAFWDCGEYIGASHSLGIPHPPGNPLYVLIGRVFSIMFFFFKQVAFRINLISVFAGAFTAMFIYLITVRAMISFVGMPDNRWKQITIYLSGVVGALYCAFGYTFWFSAVEASVYIPSMLFVAMNTWISIVWAQSKDPDRDRYLILFAYLAFLGIAIHMMSMLSLIPVFLFVALSDQEKLKDWRFWTVSMAMGSVIYNMSWFLWLAPLTVVVTLIMSYAEKSAKKKWRLLFWITFFAVLGYSVHAYIPIRSTSQPIIDENHPVITMDEKGKVDWHAFKGFLERKQYGSESMITRMTRRLGAFNKQFGIDGHMGYGGFHITQFFHFGRSIGIDRNATVVQNWGQWGGFWRLLLYLIPTILMFYAWGYFYKKNPNMAILLIFLFLIGSVILVLYMNFADGTRATKQMYRSWVENGRVGQMQLQHREVRIRDYFFTSGFMFFGMWMGLAVGAILHNLFTNKNKLFREYGAPIMVVLFAVSPVLPYTQNFAENKRTRDWIPYDYAYNLLMSCEKDGILFTNGDNDTFPLWFLQEAEGIRRDVRIVNLSLLNTKWYIRQLKDLEPIVPISFTHKHIDNKLNHVLNPFEKTFEYDMPKAGIKVMLPGRDQKRAMRIQDWMVVNIVDANAWQKPIYFAVTVSSGNLMGLDPYLKMKGLVYEVQKTPVARNNKLDIDATEYLLERVYSYRSLGDNSAPITETGRKLMSNYAASYIQMALVMRQPLGFLKNQIGALEKELQIDSIKTDTVLFNQKKVILSNKVIDYNEDLDMIINKLDQCVALMPWDWRPRMLRQEFLITHDKFDLAQKRIEEALNIEPENPEYIKMKARGLEMAGKKQEANKVLLDLAATEKDPWAAYSTIAANYEELGFFDSAIFMIEKYSQMYPADGKAAARIALIEQKKKSATEKTIDTAMNKKEESKEVVAQ